MANDRIETDSLGPVRVPKDALYQAQTQRAKENFQYSERRFPGETIDALIAIKACAAEVNASLKLLDPEVAKAIGVAAEQALQLNYDEQFPLDVFQTGSGTSSNMNVNEVLASLATAVAGKKVHPNDHINMGQSSNDVIPSAIQLSTVRLLREKLYPALEALTALLATKAQEFSRTVKTGRTHLMDAMPITLGQELQVWRQQLQRARERIAQAELALHELPLGGTAVGTGVNTPSEFAPAVCQLLSQQGDVVWSAAVTPAVFMSAQEHTLNVMSALKNLAIVLLKVCNDLRWMNSGPVAGLNEIQLTALQPGSSIMPGKVNPVIPEAVAMIAADVIGHECALTVAAQSGNFQLNVMLPLFADKLVTSILLLSRACESMGTQVFASFTFNDAHSERQLALNPILATALNRRIGYDCAAKIAKRSALEGRPVIDVAVEETDISRAELEALLNPLSLTGVQG